MGKIQIIEDSFDAFSDLHTKADNYVQNYATKLMITYLEAFEPETIKKLITEMPDKIEHEFQDTKDLEKVKTLFREWCLEWKTVFQRLDKERTQRDLSDIHKLKKQLNINTYDYRNILMQEAGAQSASSMRYYQIKLAIRALKLFSEGKLEIIPWDKGNEKIS